MKKTGRILLVLLLALALAACGEKKADSDTKTEATPSFYYLNISGNELYAVDWEMDSQDMDELISEAVTFYNQSVTENEKYVRLLPSDVSLTGYELDGALLTLDFPDTYQEMPASREILVRSGIVRTLVAIDGVNSVRFRVGGELLKTASGTEVGAMNERSFVDAAGADVNSYQHETLHLYFADATGQALKEEVRSVYYDSNVPLAKVVVEELMDGPTRDGMLPIFPAEPQILNATVQDGICYLNFDALFQNAVWAVDADIALYAIVNSITETCQVDKVQFSVNGSSDEIFQDKLPLNQLYEYNEKLVDRS